MAIFSGLLGAYGLRAVLLGETTPPPPPQPVITVPLAAADLPAGRKIALSDIALHQMTRKQMTEAGIANTEVMLGTSFIIGRTLEQPIQKDQPFTTTALFLEGTGQNVAESLQPGERAVAIEVNKRRGGNLSTGTVVDVLFRSHPRAAAEGQLAIPEKTVTLFEGVRIVAVETPPPSSGPDPNSLDLRLTNGRFLNTPKPQPLVTLAVTLEQANVLQTVEGRGELTLIPRGVEEAMPSGGANAQNHMTLEGLLGVQEPAKPFVTEIYRGGDRQQKQFNPNGTSVDLQLAP
ncbi:MAG: Flp pilus assembly protein CpaB [Planctomycetales bacterium]|nr:Flp pilus assembly protein CpaB [Planctomycetales bacterium]